MQSSSDEDEEANQTEVWYSQLYRTHAYFNDKLSFTHATKTEPREQQRMSLQHCDFERGSAEENTVDVLDK